MRTQQQIYINDLDISIIPLIRSSIMISFTLARNELQGTRADLSYWTRISEREFSLRTARGERPQDPYIPVFSSVTGGPTRTMFKLDASGRENCEAHQ